MARQTNKSDKAPQSRRKSEPRSWVFSLFFAATIVGLAVILSATVNPLFGRSVHWDWMAGVAPVGFAALTMAFRRGWA